MAITRRTWLAGAAAAAGLVGHHLWKHHEGLRGPPWHIPPPVPGEPSERFFAFGDSGSGGPGQMQLARVMQTRAAQGLDFALLLGDNFYKPSGIESADDPRWESCIALPYGPLAVPLYAILGNHDYEGDPTAQLARSAIDPRWRMPARYYSFDRMLADGTLLRFVALDTTAIIQIHEESHRQLEWLDATLADPAPRWTIAYGHHPILSGKEITLDQGHLQRAMAPILKKRRIDLYLAGHEHSLQLVRSPEAAIATTYVVSGGGGGSDNSKGVKVQSSSVYADTGGGFVAIRATRSRLVVEFVGNDGATSYAQTIERATAT